MKGSQRIAIKVLINYQLLTISLPFLIMITTLVYAVLQTKFGINFDIVILLMPVAAMQEFAHFAKQQKLILLRYTISIRYKNKRMSKLRVIFSRTIFLIPGFCDSVYRERNTCVMRFR